LVVAQDYTSFIGNRGKNMLSEIINGVVGHFRDGAFFNQ
jgi:hypothetical protein